MRHWFVAAALLGCALSAPAAATNLAVNGSFETELFTGWTRFGDNTLVRVAPSQNNVPTDGNFLAYFGNADFGGIAQTIASPAGTFAIGFDLSNRNGAGSLINFGNTTLLADVPDTLGEWVHFNFTRSVGADPLLVFGFSNPSDYYELDNVVVTRLPVPEPASWALLVAGFGIAGTMLRRRRAPVTG
jgi:hypothetical protein